MAQLAQWLVFIEQFDFDVLHRTGVRYGNADGLSRKPTEASDDNLLICGSLGDTAVAERDVNPDVFDGLAGELPKLPDELLADVQLLDPRLDRLPGCDCSKR